MTIFYRIRAEHIALLQADAASKVGNITNPRMCNGGATQVSTFIANLSNITIAFTDLGVFDLASSYIEDTFGTRLYGSSHYRCDTSLTQNGSELDMITGNSAYCYIYFDGFEIEFDYNMTRLFAVIMCDDGNATAFAMPLTTTLGTVYVPSATTEITSPVVLNGFVVGTCIIDPTVETLVYNGNPLPTGSVVRRTTTGVKYIKKAGGDKVYTTIPTTPDAAWNWLTGSEAWTVLNDM